MNHQRKIRRLNEAFGRELGRTIDDQPLYCWMWSEDSRLMHGMRVPGEYDYKADPGTGIIEALPVYRTRKLCLVAENQWVLCHWIASPSEEFWRKAFGYQLEWPKKGQYWPTNVALDKGTEPDDILTQTAIESIRLQLSKKAAEMDREFEEAEERRARLRKQQLYDRVRDDLPTYDHVPGKCDQISYPTASPAEPIVSLD